MYIIGLTGGIASGKSTVSGMLRSLGAKVIDADQIAREVVQPGCAALKEIAAVFGSSVLSDNGGLNREVLGKIVFNNSEARQKLNNITHNRICEQVWKAIVQLEREGYNMVVLDVPLLFETGWDAQVNEVWVVAVPIDVQIDRLMKRNRFTRAEALARIASQMDLKSKVERADVIIDNGASKDVTRRQVVEAWQARGKQAKTTP